MEDKDRGIIRRPDQGGQSSRPFGPDFFENEVKNMKSPDDFYFIRTFKKTVASKKFKNVAAKQCVCCIAKSFAG
jgi:hypothetical protein